MQTVSRNAEAGLRVLLDIYHETQNLEVCGAWAKAFNKLGFNGKDLKAVFEELKSAKLISMSNIDVAGNYQAKLTLDAVAYFEDKEAVEQKSNHSGSISNIHNSTIVQQIGDNSVHSSSIGFSFEQAVEAFNKIADSLYSYNLSDTEKAEVLRLVNEGITLAKKTDKAGVNRIASKLSDFIVGILGSLSASGIVALLQQFVV